MTSYRWHGTGGRRHKNVGSILRPFLPADSAPMSSERGEEMKCVRWRGDEAVSYTHLDVYKRQLYGSRSVVVGVVGVGIFMVVKYGASKSMKKGT